MSKGYSICSNLIIKILQQSHWRNIWCCCFRVLTWYRFPPWCFCCLLYMLNGVTYTEVELQSTAPHLIELFSRQFLRNSPKITNQLFFKSFFRWLLWLTSGISLESVPDGATHKKICLFLYDFKTRNCACIVLVFF